MNNKTKIFTLVLVTALALAALGVGVAFAQTPTPANGYGPGMMGGRGGMMGDYVQNSDGWEWMDGMHEWMSAGGGMHTFIWDALAEELGLTSDELTAEINSGKTIAQVAEEHGISRADLIVVMETAHEDALAQAVAEGYLTQEQADVILTQMDGHYEWMIDNISAGYGMMGGRGGMMGGYSHWQTADGQFVPGGCHGAWDNDTTDPQPQP